MVQVKLRSAAIACAKCAFSIAILVVLVRSVPEDIDWPRFMAVDVRWLTVAVCAGLLQFMILALRWRLTTLTLLGSPLPEFESSRVSFASMLWISAAISQILPGLVAGDGYRIAALRSRGLGLRAATASVVSDRLMGMAALFALAVPGLILLLQDRWHLAWTLASVVFGGVLIFLLWRLRASLARVLPGWLNDYLRLFSVRFTSPRGAYLLGMAVIGHGISVFMFFCVGRALNLNLPALPLVLLFPFALFAAMVPISAGGWGVREFTLVGSLVAFGSKASEVLLASVFFGILNVALSATSILFIVASLVKARGSKS